MLIFDTDQVKELLDWQGTVEAIEAMFAHSCTIPERLHYQIPLDNQPDATLLLMPAWIAGKYNGVKLVSLYPGNSAKGLETIQGIYLLIDGATGEMLAQLDGAELTARRTVCASALASKYLSRDDANHLLIVGSGRLARYLGFAHHAVRSLNKISIWARNQDKGMEVAESYRAADFDCNVIDDLQAGCADADIISCATMATEPLISGSWLNPGTHLDLVGGFKPTMREADDEAVARSTLFVDTRTGVLAEAGDLLGPMERGVIDRDDIAAELSELVSGHHPGRRDRAEITLFKSVGTAIEDLAAAVKCYENRTGI
ncbi:MAG: ornithine cyclodeaminase family protein [Desulfofustis sp.]|nr:ornithine cyclodeaminase family protein [Desulfofustis sp.]MBT8355303.1 ornithine cyclodeaminase family protein [Desulfofustis sp.]NNF47568.1 ornithine cyclodeaminase family protein [Desulfofustis sp.]